MNSCASILRRRPDYPGDTFLTEYCYEFTNAITRLPATSIVDGLRAEDIGNPDHQQMLRDHAHYVATLREAGATVTELSALEAYPDSVFVEDVALCLPEVAIMMRPGAPSRLGEVEEMAPVLRDLYDQVFEIKGPGFIEGGDILTTSREILVGRSARTDTAGIAELAEITGQWGYRLREVNTPEGVLHFKTDCSLLDADTILSTRRLDASGCFEGYRVIHTSEGEDAAANTIRFNQLVLMPAGFPRTRDKLLAEGYEVREINNSECARLDGGMSCLSLRFQVGR
jgi:dimethylargininase